VGGCTCPPAFLKDIQRCQCPPGRCFDPVVGCKTFP
jgi:hypothetical protein